MHLACKQMAMYWKEHVCNFLNDEKIFEKIRIKSKQKKNFVASWKTQATQLALFFFCVEVSLLREDGLSRAHSLVCRHQSNAKRRHAVQLQWTRADQSAPSAAGHRVRSGSRWKRFCSFHLLLPLEALEKQHGATLQPGSGWLHAHHGSAPPSQLLPVGDPLDFRWDDL